MQDPALASTAQPLDADSDSNLKAAAMEQDKDHQVPQFKPGRGFYLAFLSLTVLTLMVALDGTTLSVALPVISRALKGSALEAFWSGTAFLLASTVFQPTFAQFSHVFGRVQTVLSAMVLFFIGIIVAGVSKNFTYLLTGRTLQGIGGGGIIALTEIIITDLVPLRYRGQWNGIIGGMWAIGSVTGPVIGGAFAQTSWRWIFWLNLPFIGISFVLIPVFLRLRMVPSSLKEKLRRIDWIGSVIFIASTTSILIPITWGGTMYAWSSWHTLVPLLVGIAGIGGFIVYEHFVPEPLIPNIFKSRTINLGWLFAVTHGIILWCLLYYEPLYFEAVKGYKPVLAGVALFPASFTVAPLSIVAGIVITKTGRYRWSIWSGWLITTLGMGLLTIWKVDSPVYIWVLTSLVTGIGLGTLFPSMLYQIQSAVEPKEVSFAAAMFSFFRALGQAIGVAIGGTIFQNQMRHNLLRTPEFADQASELAKNAAALVELIKNQPAAERLVLRTAYTDSLRIVNATMCALAGACLLLSVLIKKYDINVGLETDQGLVNEKPRRREEQASKV